MTDETMELSLDELEAVSGGIKMSGGVFYNRAKNCPVCGATLMWTRNSKKTECMKCYAVVEAVASSGNPNYGG